MAQTYQKYKRKTRRAFPIPRADAPTEPTKYDPAKQVEGLEKRLEGSGIDPKEATDKRNFVEKALNLPEGQNFLFDLFEVYGRPQQAFFGGIKALQEGGSFDKGFSEGLSGDDYTYFAEIVRNAGIGDEESIGADDVIGFFGDVFLDPMDIALLAGSIVAAPFTKGTSVPAGFSLFTAVNFAQNANSVRRAYDAYNAARTLGKAVDSLEGLNRFQKAIRKITDPIKATKKLYKEVGKSFRRGQIREGLGKLLTSKPVRLMDGTAIIKKSPMDFGMAPFKSIFKFGGAAVKYTTKLGVTPFVKDFNTASAIVDNGLKAIESWLNKGARIGGQILTAGQVALNKVSGNRIYKEAYMKQIIYKLDDLAEKKFKAYKASGQFVDMTDNALKQKAFRDVNKELLEVAEINYKPLTTRGEVLHHPDRATFPIDQAVRDQVAQIVNNPAFQDIKLSITNSVKSQKVYATLSRRLNLSLKKMYSDVVETLQKRKDELIKNGAKQTDAVIKKIDGTIEEFSNDLKKITSEKITTDSYDALRKRADKLLNNENLTEEQLSALQAVLETVDKNIKQQSLNVIDDIFEMKYIEGKRVYVFTKKGEQIVKRLDQKIETINKIISEDVLENFKNGRFASGSIAETQIRKFLKEIKSEKSFDELFELNSTGDWIARNKQELDSYIKMANVKSYMDETIDGARFRTNKELAALKEKYKPGFEFEQEYNEIIQVFEDAVNFIDEGYGTKFVNLGDKEYVGHALTVQAKESKRIRQAMRNTFGDPANVEKTQLLGNTQVYAGRRYRMSVDEANRIYRFNKQRLLDSVAKGEVKLDDELIEFLQSDVNDKLFSEYFTDSVADTFIKLNGYGSAVKTMDAVLVAGWATNKDILRIGDQSNEVANKMAKEGFTAVPKENLRKKLLAMTKVYDSDNMNRLINDLMNQKGTIAYIDNNVYDMIGRLTDQKNIQLLEKVLIGTNNTFKRLKIFSLGFHFKNLVGNASNLYLAGVPPQSIGPMLIRGIYSKGRAKKLVDRFAASGLSMEAFMGSLKGNERELMRAYNIFLNAGFEDAATKLFDLETLITQQTNRTLTKGQMFKKGVKELASGKPKGVVSIIDSALQFNIDLNQLVDNGYRLGYIQRLVREGLTDEQIIYKVKTALLDPGTLTAAEKNVFRKVIPFYTFTKKNLAFHMKNITKNPEQYKRFIRGIRSSWNFVNVDWEEDLQPYQKENLWIPVPLTRKDDKYFQLKTSFPLSDLGEFVENPAQKILGSLTPLIRAPFEATLNTQVFTGQPIERFEGEKGRDLGQFGASAKLEYVIDQTGLDRLAAPAVNVVNLLQNNDSTAVAPTVVSEGSVETARRSAAYDRLNELRDLFKYYKQEEIPILTLSEIENMNKQRANIAQRLAKLRRKTTRLLRRRAR